MPWLDYYLPPAYLGEVICLPNSEVLKIMITEFSEKERQRIEVAKNQGWKVVQVMLPPGIKGYQLQDSEGNGRQYAASEPECWKMALLSEVI